MHSVEPASQTMNQRQSNHCDIENQDTADMRDTGVEALALFSGGDAQDTFEYQHIRNKYNQRI